MSKKIPLEDLNKEISKYLNEYKEEIDEDVKTTATTIAKEVKSELNAISPESDHDVILRGGAIHPKGQYKKGWTISQQTSKNTFCKKVWNKTDYRLTHLLEFGHATRNGGHTRPIAHVRPTENKYMDKFEQELESKIKRGN